MAQSFNLSQIKQMNMHVEDWTIHDKLAMYRGLVKIYNREQSNQVHDLLLLKKQNYKKITALKEEVKMLRNSLNFEDNSQVIYQTNQQLRLAFKNAKPWEIKDDMESKNFGKRKLLDKLKYDNVKAEETVAAYQLELEKLESGKVYDDFQSLDRRQILHNKIQDFEAKVQTGKNIQNLYKKMILLLGKDQKYYEAVLASLKDNSKLQQSCIIRAIEMGQLATEEATNMRLEYQKREHDVRQNMETQLVTLKEMESQLAGLLNQSQTLIRTESFTALGLDFSHTSIEVEFELERQVSELNTLLKRMQNAILVPGFSDIFPRMLELLKQNEKLLEDLNANDNEFCLLLEKIDHASLIITSEANKGASDSATFHGDKGTLLVQLQHENESLEKIIKEQDKVGRLIISLRHGLHRLWNIAEPIAAFVDAGIPEHKLANATGVYRDALRFLFMLTKLYMQIQELAHRKIQREERDRMLASRFKRRARLHIEARDEKAIQHVSLNFEEEVEDPAVPSRADIKMESNRLYHLAAVNSYDVNAAKPKKKTRKCIHKK